MEGTGEKQLQTQELGKERLTINTRWCIKGKSCVVEAIKVNGWNETTAEGEGDIIFGKYSDFEEFREILTTKKEVAYNKIPGMNKVASKSGLADILCFMSKFYPADFNFTPKTYVLPREEEDCKKEMNASPGKTWILKPSDGCCGDDIRLVNEYSEITEHIKEGEYVIQTYIHKPLLMFKKKFDIRFYLVLYGTETMHAYLYEEGIARVCTSEYEEPTSTNKDNILMHLTNYSINSKSDEFAKKGRVIGNQDIKKKL